ncbi:MAG: hypothetical protein MJ137_06355 [Clostridia bacterium]|nr:hypothetical protein [Clostridia bacterium]
MKKERFSIRILCCIICFVMVFGAVISAAERPTIASVEASSPDYAVPALGAEVKSYIRFTTTAGEPAYISHSMNRWEIKTGEDSWKEYTGKAFVPGTYRFWAQLRTDDCPDVVTPATVLTVNGEPFSNLGATFADGGETYSYLSYYSPYYTLTEAENTPLTFVNSTTFELERLYVGKEITSYSLASYVYGGKKPYLFTWVSGPQWINIAQDGTVTGTPDAEAPATEVWVNVIDADYDSSMIKIPVGSVNRNPDSREVIKNVVAHTVNVITMPVVGGTVDKDFQIEVTVGEPATASSYGVRWQKKDGETWVDYYEDTFTEGIYRMYCQIRTDSYTHVLSPEINVSINGMAFTKIPGDMAVGENYSYDYFHSPEIECASSAPDRIWAGVYTSSSNPEGSFVRITESHIDPGDNWNISSGGNYMNGQQMKAEAKAPAGYEFDRWTDINGSFVSDENPYVFTVSQTLMLYPVFRELPPHEHVFSPEWSGSAGEHWHGCDCGEHAEEAAHAYADWVIVKEPTEEAEGEKNHYCTVCDYVETEEMPKIIHVHDLIKTEETPPDCTHQGMKAYYHCGICNKDYKDADCAEQIFNLDELTIPAAGHRPGEKYEVNENEHWLVCDYPGCGITIEASIQTHTASAWIVDKEPTKTEEGSRHKECKECGYVMKTRSIAPADGLADADTDGITPAGIGIIILDAALALAAVTTVVIAVGAVVKKKKSVK